MDALRDVNDFTLVAEEVRTTRLENLMIKTWEKAAEVIILNKLIYSGGGN
jgi:hypothetical protein